MKACLRLLNHCMNVSPMCRLQSSTETNNTVNFLYNTPLIIRVFTTNCKVGRKYAKNEQGLLLVGTQRVIKIFCKFDSLSHRFCGQSHCFCAVIYMLLRHKYM